MNSPLSRFRANKMARSGFSLVEVTLALGVMAFTIISLMGLLTTGCQSSQQSMRRNMKSEIAQGILGAVQLSRYQLLAQFDNNHFFFDAQGNPLPSGDNKAVYQAQTTLAAPKNQIDFAPSQNVATNVVVDVWAVAEPSLTNRTVRLIVAGD